MSSRSPVSLDVLIIGGGIAGLWLLHELRNLGFSVLLIENSTLGSGQTITSQGILHGGVKYSLQGMFTRSAQAVAQMPSLWREALSGNRVPDLSQVQLRGEYCHLWRSESVSSRLGMLGAQVGLTIKPKKLSAEEIPTLLRNCPGTVYRLDEQVLSPHSLIQSLAESMANAIVTLHPHENVLFQTEKKGEIQSVQIVDLQRTSHNDPVLEFQPKHMICTAGAGNQELLRQLAWNSPAVQRRPLQMVVIRSRHLPQLNGHCIDGKQTRVTITSEQDSSGNMIWQLGGQLAEEGVSMSCEQLIEHAIDELKAVIPEISLEKTEWMTYRVDRAERAIKGTGRPDSIQISQKQNVFLAWPTKLVLAPKLAEELIARLPASPQCDQPVLNEISRELKIALPPWETQVEWISRESN